MTSQIIYQVRLEQEVVFRNANGDPNLVRSEGFIPGSNIWGALADHVLRPASWNLDNTDFRELFSQNNLYFLNAYPYTTPYSNGTAARFLPVPLSFRQPKADDTRGYDLSAGKNPPDESTSRLGSSFVYFNGSEEVVQLQTRSRFNYHISRNRAKGRATRDDGAVFVYEALLPGQQFEGRILGSESNLTRLYEILGGSEILLRLGRSRAVQYGGNVRLKLGPPTAFEREVEVEVDENQADLGKMLVVTLLSTLLVRNETGYNSLEFPKEALARLLDPVNPPVLELEKAYTRPIMTGGYWTPWKMPRQQWPGLAAGSVFIFKSDRVLTGLKPVSVETHSLGERVGEGFGRFAFNCHTDHFEFKLAKAQSNDPMKPTQPPPQGLPGLVKELVKSGWLKQAEEAGLQEAARFGAEGLSKVTPALLNRLRQIFAESEDLESTRNYFNERSVSRLRNTAWQQLERLRTNDGPSNITSLLGSIKNALDSRLDSALFNLDLALLLPTLETTGWNPLVEGEEKELRTALVKCYLITLVEQLSRQQRTFNDN